MVSVRYLELEVTPLAHTFNPNCRSISVSILARFTYADWDLILTAGLSFP